MTKIMNCLCLDSYQDTTYGIGKRVFNMCKKVVTGQQWRCTKCGKTTS